MTVVIRGCLADLGVYSLDSCTQIETEGVKAGEFYIKFENLVKAKSQYLPSACLLNEELHFPGINLNPF